MKRAVRCALALMLLASAAHAQTPPSVPASAPAPAPAAEVIPPKVLSDTTVPYPQGATGDATVVLVVVIGDDGIVRSARASEENEPFSRYAADAALLWRFEPATRGGKPTPARIRMEVTFVAPRVVETPAEVTLPETPATPKAEAQEVLVRGARVEPSRTATLSRTEVRQIPGTFGDPFRAIEIMPGVTPIVSGLPFFFVRGAPPGDVGYFLDGVRVPYLFHVGAGPSVIHPALIDRVDLYPGGYPARYGRFSGGIVSGETAPPSKELHGEYNVRLFDAGAMIESPFANGRGSAEVSGRYSYTAALLSLVASDTALSYWDYQARAGYDLTPRDRVSVFSFGASDFLGQKTPTGTTTLFGVTFHRLDVRYDHQIDDNGTLRAAVTGGIDRTELDNGRFLRDRLIGARTEIDYRASPIALVRLGTDLQTDSYDIVLDSGDLSPSDAKIAASFPSRTDLALGLRGDVVLNAGKLLEITPGVRFDLFSSQGASAVAVDPRLATRTVLTDRLRLLGAMGVAHQTPAFVIPVPGFQPGGLRGGLQEALQESMGVEYDLGQGTTATATVFHNAFFNMSDALSVMQPEIQGCAPGTFPTDTLAGDPGGQPGGRGTRQCGQPRFPVGTVGGDRSGGGGQGAQSTGDANAAAAFETRANGTAYGLELFLKRKLTSKLGGFLSYTLSRSIRTANGQTFTATFDRTHVLNAAVAYDLGKNWRAGTRVTFYTGLPKAPDPTDPGATRLAPFYRVDLRIEKRWQLSHKWWISFVAEWMNATLSKESIGTSCTLNGCQETKIGPVTIPSIGVEGGF